MSGAEHLDTLAARATHGYFVGEAGHAAGARDRYAALLPVIEQVVGAGHPATQAARARLASSTAQAGRSPNTRKDSRPS